VPEAAITAVRTSDREELRHMLTLDSSIDLVIPRGNTDLIRFVKEHSRIPTIQHYRGVCHVYVDRAADPDVAERVAVNAKVSGPATCNAAECVLVDRAVAGSMVPRLAGALRRAGVEVRGDAETMALDPAVRAAGEDDFGREFLDLVVAMAVVDGVGRAIEHIARHGSDHTEAIVTADRAAAERFTREVRSSCVLVNASTRLNDGYALGLGAEIGISTSRLHAYGPMGLEELTTTRFVVEGDGHLR
jgi:glutamate-5-semialdehyde dehydrogenase